MLYWIPALIWMIIIFYLSSRTGSELQSLVPFINNFNPGHVVAYFILALLYYFAFQKNNSSRPFVKTFILCLLYGITDEIHQFYVPTRFPDPYDLVRDLLGALGALVIVLLIKKSHIISSLKVRFKSIKKSC